MVRPAQSLPARTKSGFLAPAHTLTASAHPEFDARTFKVMSELIEQDPHVPLYFATQREYREEVRRDDSMRVQNELDVKLTRTL